MNRNFSKRRILMSADALEAYEKVLPGAADRIMKMSAEEVEHNMRMSELREELKRSKAGGMVPVITTIMLRILALASALRFRRTNPGQSECSSSKGKLTL